MLSPKFVRQHLLEVVSMLERRSFKANLQPFKDLEATRLELIQEVEGKKALRNTISKQVGFLKSKGESIPEGELKKLRELSDTIKQMDEEFTSMDEAIREICLHLPNMLSETVPDGKDESANQVLRHWGRPREFDFEPKNHLELSRQHDLLDFERAAKVSGNNFVFMKGVGARLERCLTTFFLEKNIDKGYTEYLPPFVVNESSLLATGQLPKFKRDLFEIKNSRQPAYLIPTAEVPLTNLFQNELLSESQLPIKITGASACFREEAGAAGQETQGLIRLHQFNKVELVAITTPGQSDEQHELMLGDVEALLQSLKLPYRVVLLCSGDTGFAAAKCYDVEVWMPSRKKYVEVSSCSNCWDFQSQRASIRYKPTEGGKNLHVHTLNASGLAVGRTLAAVLENGQQKDGSVFLPEALQVGMGTARLGRPNNQI